MNGNKTEQRKGKSNLGIETPGKPKTTEIISRCKTIPCKIYIETIGKNRKTSKTPATWNWGKQQDKDFNNIKKMLTEDPCLAHYAKDRENIVTTDARKTGLRITLWQKQSDGETKPISFGSRYLNGSEKSYSIGELEILAVVWGLETFRL